MRIKLISILFIAEFVLCILLSSSFYSIDHVIASETTKLTPGHSSLSLNSEEISWLNNHPVIRVVQDPSWPPIEFADAKGHPTGMSSDYLKLIEQRLGITFERIENLSWQEAYDKLKLWEIDMTPSVTLTPDRTKFWAFTKPYRQIPIVIFTQADVTYISSMHELSGKKIAVVEGYAVNEWIPRDFPDIKLVQVKNSNEGIDLLQQGDVFAYIDNMLVVSYYLTKLKVANVKIAGETPYTNKQSMAVRKDWPILAGILQKALDSISKAEHAQIYNRWAPIRYEHGFNYKTLWKALAFLVIVFMGLIVWNLKLYREIRQRRAAEIALGKSEKKFRQIYDNILDVYYETDLKGVILEVSPSIQKNSKYTREELLGKSVYDLYTTPSDRDRLSDIIMTTGSVRDYEISLKDKDGRQQICSMNIELIKDAENKPVKIIGIFRDVTQRNIMEEELTRERVFVDAIFNSIPGLLYLYDAEGKLVRWNKKHELMTGYSSEELSSMSLMDWYKDDAKSQDAVSKGLEKTMTNGFGDAVAYLQKKDGSTIPVYFTASPLMINEKQYFTGIGIDITAQKEAEKEQKILQRQLIQSQKMQAIGTLAGGIAHDFNNILSGIFGYTNLATNNLDDQEKLKNHIEQITAGARRAADLVQQILTFSRKTEYEKRAVKLYLIVKEAIKFLRSSIPSNIQIHESISSDSVALIDPTQFHQIIMNLCTNAFHAMKVNGGILSIDLEDIEISESKSIPDLGIRTGNYIKMEISDTGSGMDTDTLARIFEPYFTTKEIEEGTGLGLAVVLGIVQEHGGYLKSYSEIGKGSTFKVYLPISQNQEKISELKTKKNIVKKGTESIMLVDDDSSILSSTQELLTENGYQVAVYKNGKEAFDEFKKNPDQFHLIISDITMPKMTGDTLLKEIYEIRKDVPIILCSGYSEDYSKSKILKTGLSKYLQKPLDSEDLLYWIRELLDKK